MKRCHFCSKEAGHDVYHDESEFGKCARYADGLQHSCKPTYNAYVKVMKRRSRARLRLTNVDLRACISDIGEPWRRLLCARWV